MEAFLWATYQIADAMTDAMTDATMDVEMEATTVVVYSAAEITTVCGGLSSSSYSVAVATTVPGVPLTVVAADTMTVATTTTITAAVLLSGSSYYHASAETEVSSNLSNNGC